jgi:hypothetical protein
MKRLVTFALCGLMLVGLTGCLVAAAAAGAGGVAYIKGDLEANVGASPEEVEQATQAAFKEMGITLTESESTAVDASMKGKSSGDTIRVKAKTGEHGGSEVSVRVGTFGDESRSRAIFETIEKHLPAGKGVVSKDE